MGFFSPDIESAALLDVRSGSVGGAFLFYPPKKSPTLAYSVRVPVEPRQGEALADACARSCAALLDRMRDEGARSLARETGSGRARTAFVSIGTPWQQASVRIERFEKEKPFIFSRSLMNDIVGNAACASPDRVECGESVVATILNGYETGKPFGKRARRADIVVLSSSIDRTFSEKLEEVFRAHPGLRRPELMAADSLTFQAFKRLYPHEKRFVTLDAARDSVGIVLVQEGLPASILSVPPEALRDAFAALARDYTLPRTLFLISDENARAAVAAAFEHPAFRSLWLSEQPPSLIPVAATNLANSIGIGHEASADIRLMLLALVHEMYRGIANA